MNFVAIKMLPDDRAKYLGRVFHRAIDRVLATLAALGAGALALIVAGLGVFVAAPLLQGASDGTDLSPEGLTLGQRRPTMEGLERQSCCMDRRAISVVAEARNHLSASRWFGFRFEISV